MKNIDAVMFPCSRSASSPCGWCSNCYRQDEFEGAVDAQLTDITNRLLAKGRTEDHADRVARRIVNYNIEKSIEDY